MTKLRIGLALTILLVLMLAASSGSFLVVNDLQHADILVVLAGETDRRPARGLELLSQNYAPKMLLNVPAHEVIYDRSQVEIAREYIQSSPYRERIEICPIAGLSTKAEAQDCARCLEHSGAQRILLVTSDYHTRRARSIFQRELRSYKVFVSAASDPQQFGTTWWKHRQWAKMNFDEWLRLMWWELFDRWR